MSGPSPERQAKYHTPEVGAALASWMSNLERLNYSHEPLSKMMDIHPAFAQLDPRVARTLAEVFVRQQTRLPVMKQRSKTGKTYSFIYEEPDDLVVEANEARDEAELAESHGEQERAAEFRDQEKELRARARLIRMLRALAAQINKKGRSRDRHRSGTTS